MANQRIPQLGWVGLGKMGNAMAKNIQRHLAETGQSPLHFWNRTASKGEQLKGLGGVECESIAAVVNSSDIIFISTSDDAALKIIVDEILAAGNIDLKIIVDTTTVHPTTSQEVSGKVAQKNATFISAPVFGSSPMAEDRKILIVLAGDLSGIKELAPYLKGVIARETITVSDKSEKAALLKIMGNFIISGFTEIIGEAHVLAEKSEMGNEALENLLELQFGLLPGMISKRLTQGENPWSDLSLGLKDVGHSIDCADSTGTRLKVAEVALDHLKRANTYSEQEGRPLDSSAMYGIIRQDAGLDFENDFVKKRDAQ
ncbi:NAD binding domain of 6-phosphogluconate dehydrogenase-domain-containing protein [Aspergillus pseudocaelatus]|uniref:NAD binding domain of 6-phosphogluconate dehydrogenase-domain-containing protein n=1 Tax=Aspergillus pseudocaelatus TaxID=1825620 RepID=A0ABQ6WCV7_9EURO|nr:NAD binding domain of 6-phosphogluconate dehydrogenase-domain-containing protein [Aspergillus pseudocaelatus]